jgi:hypothetical protein
MATPVIDPTKILNDPGILYYAPLGTSEPSMTVASSIFSTAAWGGLWVALGPTDEGTEFNDKVDTDDMTVEESAYPVKTVVTKKEATISFSLVEFTATQMKRAANGGSNLVTGSGATTLTTFTPPAVGQEVRAMIGWQSQQDDVRFIGYQALQIGTIKPRFRRGVAKSVFECNWKFELSSLGYPYRFFFAGTTRA